MTLRFAGFTFALTLAFTSSALFAACSGGDNTTTNASSSGSEGTMASGAGGASGGTGQGGGGTLFDAAGSGTGGGGDSYLIYAHTDTTLFSLDPSSPNLALQQIGDFDCVPSQTTAMTDLAIDQDQHLWALSSYAVRPVTIQGSTVHCGQEIPIKIPDPQMPNKSVPFYALTFAPTGVLDPNKEVLIAGNTSGELWAIDDQSKLTQHGKFGTVPATDGNKHPYDQTHVGKLWELSGDIVFLANKGNPVGFATVRDCPNPPSTSGCNSVNTLIEIDLGKLAAAGTQNVTLNVRGQIVERAGCNDGLNGVFGNIYGIAAWQDHVYGFSRLGHLVDINSDDATACQVHDYPSDLFAGAGVTTIAPVLPPPPK